MPGYIEDFKKLSPAKKKKQVKAKLEEYLETLILTDAFANIVEETNPNEWDIDPSDVKITAISIENDEIHVDLTYSATRGEVDADRYPESNPFLGNLVKGEATAIIANGPIGLIVNTVTIRFEQITGDFAQNNRRDAGGKRGSGKRSRLPVGSPEWFGHWLEPLRWRTSSKSNALYVNIRGYNVAVNEFEPGVWSYRINRKDEEVAQDPGHSSELSVKRAALEKLAGILISF